LAVRSFQQAPRGIQLPAARPLAAWGSVPSPGSCRFHVKSRSSGLGTHHPLINGFTNVQVAQADFGPRNTHTHTEREYRVHRPIHLGSSSAIRPHPAFNIQHQHHIVPTSKLTLLVPDT
jgi:hypothetical protein